MNKPQSSESSSDIIKLPSGNAVILPTNKAPQTRTPDYSEDTKHLAIAMSIQGYTTRSIAKQLNIKSHTTIVRWINDLELLESIETTANVDRLKSALSTKTMIKANSIMQGMTEEKIESASLQQQAYAFGVVLDKSRLLAGESTENVSMISKNLDKLSNEDSKIDQKIKDIESKLKDL